MDPTDISRNPYRDDFPLLAANPGLSENLCHRRGFRRLPTGGPGPALMIHDEEAAGERR